MDFNKVQFRQFHDPEKNEGYVEAAIDGLDVGALRYSGKPNPSIDLIDIDDEHQRKGIGTAMYRRAMDQTGGTLQHSAHRTDAGEGFAQKMGGVIPPRIRMEF